MPITAETHVRLTDTAHHLALRGGGRLASDVSRTALRARDVMDERATMPLGDLMRTGGFQSHEIAALMREGGLELVENEIRGWTCDRCNGPAEAGTALCPECRRYLGWARLLGEDAPREAPRFQAPRLVARPRPVSVTPQRPGGMRRLGDRGIA
ncbi:MAG: hypothetical protein IT200_02720 [Thermoleophilia bacterium]|nr:hypothetical protein [Thermoleophilia bacterium]